MKELWRLPERWCILRTAGQRTLPLADSLNQAGLEAWTPRQTLRRPMRGSKPGKDGRRPTRDIDAPILPTFVFAKARFLTSLAATMSDPAGPHPAFSIMHQAGRVPLVAERDVAGLQQAELAAAALIAELRDIDTRKEQQRIRSQSMANDRERRKALRRELRHFTSGQDVVIEEAAAFAGLIFPVEAGNGHSATVMLGSMRMKIDSWRVSPNALQTSRS